MTEEESLDKFKFLHPRSSYRGNFKPEYLIFNANLQEFSQRVAYISALESNGKMSSIEAFQTIQKLWKQLKRISKDLGINNIH
jgi:hypothetical protein